jgi:hypothetical protein
MNIAHQWFIICTLQVRLRRTPGQTVLQGYIHLYKGLQLRMNLYRSTITCDLSESSRMQRHSCNSRNRKGNQSSVQIFHTKCHPFYWLGNVSYPVSNVNPCHMRGKDKRHTPYMQPTSKIPSRLAECWPSHWRWVKFTDQIENLLEEW